MAGAPGHVSGPVECWCCGERQAESSVVRLGNHPEVAVCLGCAHSLHRGARAREDVGVRSAGSAGRALLRAATSTVVRHGWHTRPVIGPVLRAIGRRLP